MNLNDIDFSTIEAALAKLGDATAKQIAEEVDLETSDVLRALTQMLKNTEVEREKRRGNEYVYWLTRDVRASAPKVQQKQPVPKAAAVAVQAAVSGQPGQTADVTEQLRATRAEAIALRQTVTEICCAIGRDPGQTSTAQLVEAFKQASSAAANAQLAVEAKDAELLEQSRLVVDLRTRLDAQIKQAQADAATLTEKNARLRDDNDRLRAELAEAHTGTPGKPAGFAVATTNGDITRHTKPGAANRRVSALIRAGHRGANIYRLTLIARARPGAEIIEA